MRQKNYKLSKSIAKALIPLAGGTTATTILLAIFGALPDSVDDLKTMWPVVLANIITAAVPGIQNAAKHAGD